MSSDDFNSTVKLINIFLKLTISKKTNAYEKPFTNQLKEQNFRQIKFLAKIFNFPMSFL